MLNKQHKKCDRMLKLFRIWEELTWEGKCYLVYMSAQRFISTMPRWKRAGIITVVLVAGAWAVWATLQSVWVALLVGVLIGYIAAKLTE
jgi:hypothetical protein